MLGSRTCAHNSQGKRRADDGADRRGEADTPTGPNGQIQARPLERLVGQGARRKAGYGAHQACGAPIA